MGSVKHAYEFGSFRLEVERHRLLRNSELITLSPRAIDALLLLVQSQWRMVKREDLMRAVWPDTFVEESNLTVAISQLRKALAENGNGDDYIETVPRLGYRFVADVREVEEQLAPLIIEKHTLSETVIEEEFLDDEPQARIRTTAAVVYETRLPQVISRHKTAALLTVGLLLATVVVVTYFNRADRKRFTAENKVGLPIRSIAILPFKPLSPEAGGDEWLGLGISDSLITRLGNVKQLIIRPTSAVIKFSGANQDPLAAGRQMGVDAVLEGHIQRAGDRIRVTMQLVGVRNGTTLWTGTFDDEFTNIFAVQDSISKQVAGALVSSLNSEEQRQLLKRPTEITEAYLLYLRGRYIWNKRMPLNVKQSISYFQQAIEKDPRFALAYVGLADAYAMLSTPAPEAEAAVKKAIELDDTLAEAHASLGFIKMFHHWAWAEAERELLRAIELNPNYATAHHWYATSLELRGRLPEAEVAMQRALELDPLSLVINADMGQLLYFEHRYDEAIKQCEKVLDLDPQFGLAHEYLLHVYAKKGMQREAEQEFLKASKGVFDPTAATPEARGFSSSGLRGFLRAVNARGLSATSNDVSEAFSLGRYHALLGNKEPALQLLRKSYNNREFLIVFISVDPAFDGLREDPRFATLVRGVGLGA